MFSQVPDSLSIRALKPLEQGGVRNRRGLAFQDHIACMFCLEMLINSCLTEVWCETQDDITLIWWINGYDEVEFVQVKSDQLEQLWTVAKLCEKRNSPDGNSSAGAPIIEKSLAYDRKFAESRRFRIVTARDVCKALKVLTLPLGSPERQALDAEYENLKTELETKTAGMRSERGNDSSFWLSRATWDVEHSAEAVKVKNLVSLTKIIEDTIGYLPAEQVEQTYFQLLQLVQDAALADWDVDPTAKKITRKGLGEWLVQTVNRMKYPLRDGTGKVMQEKMEKAGISSDYIDNAHEERALFRREILQPKYLDLTDRELVQAEVLAELDHLRLQMDNGQLPEGLPFYQVCINKLAALRLSLRTKSPPPLHFIVGCMHSIADRCKHRYMRPVP